VEKERRGSKYNQRGFVEASTVASLEKKEPTGSIFDGSCSMDVPFTYLISTDSREMGSSTVDVIR
jgi:hypothetical protein